MAKNERNARRTPRQLYKEFRRGRKFGSNGTETGVRKFFLEALQPKPRDSAVSLGSLAMENMV